MQPTIFMAKKFQTEIIARANGPVSQDANGWQLLFIYLTCSVLKTMSLIITCLNNTGYSPTVLVFFSSQCHYIYNQVLMPVKAFHNEKVGQAPKAAGKVGSQQADPA